MKRFLILFFLLPVLLNAQSDTSLSFEKYQDPKTPELTYIGYWFTRATASDISPTNELLRGQIIGRLFGPNTTNTSPRTASYVEQRFVPMFIYTPEILDGYATFRSLFKIDMTWGDNAYGVGGNSGGGINAGQVNIQTLLANVEIKANDNWLAVIGLQRIFDNPRDPNVTALGVAQTSAYKLAYWGTQGVGASIYGKLNPTTIGRIGYYQLYENIIQENDDVSLWMLDLESKIHPLIEAGVDAWYLWDRGKSAGGISVLGQGLNSALAEYNGAVRINLPTQRYEADIFWLGGHTAYNRDFLAGRVWADAFVMANFGNIDTVNAASMKAGSFADNFGLAANAQVSYKFGMTANDKIQLEGLYTTGDKNGASDGTLNSVITGNVWGSPTGIYSSHRALILFPDAQVVNRYYSAVHDISNMGMGVSAVFLIIYKDFIPNKLNTKLGFATALSNVKPQNGAKLIGSEVNFEVKYNLKVFLTLGLSAGYCKLGDFYDSPRVTYNSERPKDPWVIFTSLNWLMF